MRNFLLYIISLVLVCSGCSTIEETSKHQLETGMYNVKNQRGKKFYVVVKKDSLCLHSVYKTKAGWTADTSGASIIHINTTNPISPEKIKFRTSSFDLDVTTILFKYRPYTSGFPNQLNTNFNAAKFIGYRTDLYVLSYDKDPFYNYHRKMNHFAYSIRGFVGLGATAMNPFVTDDFIQSEYDGVILTKGFAGLLGVGQFTFGAAVGFDNLFDRNRKAWIYQGKPWIGFTVGFNIN